jgi:allophanate hydrolase subunit 2
MSLIIQDSGMLTLLQTLDPEVSARGNEYNGACDRLAHQLANQLVGNSPEQPTIEMTLRPGAIKFTEPTIVAFSGAEFKAKSGDRDIFINRIYLFDRGDELIFGESTRGNRVYLAVAGGIKVEGSNVLRSGDEVIMCRDYTPQHDELFNMLKQQKEVNWGVDTYALVEVYLSDTYHIVRRPDVPDAVYEALEANEFTVRNEKYRAALYLEGAGVDMDTEGIEHPGLKGGVYIADGQPVLALNDFNDYTTAPHIGTIPSYHLHKLVQKRAGSHIRFKCIEADDAHANLYAHHLWVKSLFKAIDYKLSKELIKEKM